jgi:hypothetical protein
LRVVAWEGDDRVKVRYEMRRGRERGNVNVYSNRDGIEGANW